MLELPTKIQFDPPHKTKKHWNQSSWKTTVMCVNDGDLDLYFAHMIEKRFNLTLNRSIRCTHVTIINDKLSDFEAYERAREIWDGRETMFMYDPAEIRSNGKHWWLKVYSEEAMRIRTVAGLEPIPHFPFHMTIGYANEKNIDHSHYIVKQILRFNL
jgi:hypothetical protein